MFALRDFFLLSECLTFFLKAFFFSHLLCYWLTGEPRFSLNVSLETAWCLTWLVPHNLQRSSFYERWGLLWGGSCAWRGDCLARFGVEALDWLGVPGDGSDLLAAGTRLSGGWLSLHQGTCLPVATSARTNVSSTMSHGATVLGACLVAL